MPFAEDLTAFVDENDFADLALFDGWRDVRGIFDRAYIDVLGVATRSPVFRCQEAKVPNAIGKRLTVRGLNYTVRGTEPDGTGLTLLRLELE